MTESPTAFFPDLVIDSGDFCFLQSTCTTVAQTERVKFTGQHQIWFNTNSKFHWVAGNYSTFSPYTNGKTTVPFLRVALHEFGHALGLPEYYQSGYTTFVNRSISDAQIMYYDYPKGEYLPLMTLGSFDINEIRKLYATLVWYDRFGLIHPLVYPDNLRSVAYKDGAAYVATRAGRILTYDVSSLLASSTGGALVDPKAAVQTSGSYLVQSGSVLYALGSGVTALSLTNKYAPAITSATGGSSYLVNGTVANSRLICVGYQSGGPGVMEIYSLAVPTQPRLLSTLRVNGQWLWSVAVLNNRAYVGDLAGNLRIIDISDAANPWTRRVVSLGIQAEHLRIATDKLVASSPFGGYQGTVQLWSLTNVDYPEFLSAIPSGAGRVLAYHQGVYLITNGSVVKIDGSHLDQACIFEPGGIQVDGVPFGTAVSPDHVFVTQTEQVLILKLRGN